VFRGVHGVVAGYNIVTLRLHGYQQEVCLSEVFIWCLEMFIGCLEVCIWCLEE